MSPAVELAAALPWWGKILGGGVLGSLGLWATSRVARAHRRMQITLKGKGFFVRGLTQYGPPSALVGVLRELGASWVLLIGESRSGQVSTHYPEKLPDYVRALEGAGIRVWLWGWPGDGRRNLEADAAQMIALAKDLGARGIVYDLEGQVYRPRFEDPVRAILSATREAGLGVGVTTYPIRRFHPGFPWAAFDDVVVDVGMPQVYDSKNKWGPGFQREALEDYAQFSRQVVPIVGAGPDQSVDDMERESLPILGRRAVGFWSLDHVMRSAQKRKWVSGLRVGRGAFA